MMFRRLYKRGPLEIYRARSSAWTEQQPSMAQRGKLMVAGSNPSGPVFLYMKGSYYPASKAKAP